MEWIMNPWPWYVGGILVALVMIALIKLGKTFGFSSNFRTMCAALGAGRSSDFFRFDWKAQQWNLLFLLGSVLGGYIAAHFLSNGAPPALADGIIDKLHAAGFASAGSSYSPTELFGEWSLKNMSIWAIGGLLIGFGTRYAGGCTSGHAISGLSDLQWPSLIAVVGFFIGGLMMVHLFFPFIF